MSPNERRAAFRALHQRDEMFVMPNPWDVGSARLLAHAGFPALATSSAAFAWSIGCDDYGVTREDVVEHVSSITAHVDVPLNVDSERCWVDRPEDIAETVQLLRDAGAAGFSVEDWDPVEGVMEPVETAAARVAAAVEAAHTGDDDALVLTARCEMFGAGIPDLDEVIRRLTIYRDAGADCVYAPGVMAITDVRAIVEAVDIPVNMLSLPGGPTLPELAEAGVRRISTGSRLASAAYGAMMIGARALLDPGRPDYAGHGLQAEDRAAFGRS